jgi:proteic killer suppression protein
MIKTFKDKETELIFNRYFSKRIPSAIQGRTFNKLFLLDSAETLNDLKIPPSNRLEKLQGNRNNQYSIRINDQWRICFIWKDGNVFDVEIIDYH